MTQESWKNIFDGFEEPTPLSFGFGDRTKSESKDWTISVPGEDPMEMLVAAWCLLQSRYSGEAQITIGFQGAERSTLYEP